MGLVERFDRKLESTVEDAFARVFGGWGFVGSILGAVFAPILFGVAGAGVLAVTGVRHYRRHGPNGHILPNSPMGVPERT